jgi:hypothetical protein
MVDHRFFDLPNLVPAANAMVSRVKPKFDVSKSEGSVGVIESGNVEMNLQKPVRLRTKKKSGKVKRKKSKNTHKTKDKKQR